MDIQLPAIGSLGARFAAAHRFDTALDCLAEEARRLGFDGVDYAFLPSARLVAGAWASGPVHTRNFPSRWQIGWARYGRHDAILPLTYRRGLPLDWQAVKHEERLTEAQLAAINYLESDMGFPGGITVPIHLPQNRFAFVSGVSSRTGAAWRALSAQTMTPLMVLAHSFHHLVARRFQPAANESLRLTRRELECLRFAAHGLSAPESALRLNRSVDTVRGHLKRAMAKLGGCTTAQAVAIAVSCGLLDVDPADAAAGRWGGALSETRCGDPGALAFSRSR